MAKKNKVPAVKSHSRLKTVLITILVVVVVLGVAGYVLLGISPVPAVSTYELDLGKVRQLAQEPAGELPLRLNVLNVGDFAMPHAMMVAGSELTIEHVAIPSFQVVYPDGTVIIDAGDGKIGKNASPAYETYKPENIDSMQEAMRRSKFILATHEHYDHVGGIALSPYLDEIISKVKFTKQQIENAAADTGFTPEILAQLTLIDYDKYYAIAPGMVLIKAAGHTPGSQMVYVRLQNGSEYLLVGDVVWSSQNVEQLTGRALFASLVLNEDWEVHRNQVRTLYDVSRSDPIHLVVSHDSQQLENYTEQGLLGDKFE